MSVRVERLFVTFAVSFTSSLLTDCVLICLQLDVIVETVNRVRPKCDYVVTSGGIGPTHDDVTYDAIAAAFGVTLEYDPVVMVGLAAYMKSRNSELNEARKRMALFPKGCRTHAVPGLWVPIVSMDNVFIYPGVPRLFERMLLASDGIFEEGPAYVHWEVFTKQLEGDFAAALTQAAALHTQVKIGSYPMTGADGTSFTRLFIEGRDEAMVQAVAQELGNMTNAYLVAPRPVVQPNSKL